MRPGPRLSNRKTHPCLDAAGAPMAPKQRRPLPSCCRGPGEPSAKVTPALMWLEHHWLQIDGGPGPSAAGPPAIRLREKPWPGCGAGPNASKATEAPALMRPGGGGKPSAKEAPALMSLERPWFQSEGGRGPDAVGPPAM